MIKTMPDSHKTKRKLMKMPKIYLIYSAADFGWYEFSFSGRYKNGVPLVWQYDDHNGTTDNWYLRKITNTTAFPIYTWTFDRLQIGPLMKAFKEADND